MQSVIPLLNGNLCIGMMTDGSHFLCNKIIRMTWDEICLNIRLNLLSGSKDGRRQIQQ